MKQIVFSIFFLSLISLQALCELHALGASNTAGLGAQLALAVRLQHHIRTTAPPKCQETLKSTEILVAIDLLLPDACELGAF